MTENELPGSEPNAEAQAEGLGENSFDALKDGLLGKVAGILPEGALDKAAEMLDRDGDGNPLNDLKGLAERFTGKD